MKKLIKYGLAACAASVMLSGPVSAADPAPTQQQTQYQLQERDMYGWDLMTEQERAQHRQKMQSMQTEQERNEYRMEHHQLMQERAKAKGVTIPDTPPPGGYGAGMGSGKGGGGGGGGKKY